MVLAGWAGGEAEQAGLHRHCFTCWDLRHCKETLSCPVLDCPAGCGARYHQCKQEEHALLCALEPVPCLNAEFGCDREMPRRDRASHLPACPASLLVCTQEWNRWPLHCRDRNKTVPFRQRNPRAERGQLDYELALRDQRCVGDFLAVPRKTKLALRNNLTRRHPALPLPPGPVRPANPTDKSMTSLQEAAKYELGDNSPLPSAVYGVAKLFLKNQEKQEKRWKDDVDAAIQRTGQPVPKRYWEFPELERGNIHKHCAHCYDIKCQKKNRQLTLEDDFSSDEPWMECCGVVDCPWNCGAVLHHCKMFEHKMICPLFEEEGEYDWMNRLKSAQDRQEMTTKKKKAPPPLKQFPDLLAGPTLCPAPNRPRPGRIPVPPPPPHGLHHTMRLDIRVETVTKLQQKPRSMFTFLCGAEVRRDQWEGHCQDVHSNIHGGLNNWLEARCPLASIGCGFAVRRLVPGGVEGGARIVYSQDLSSFGVRPATVALPAGRPGHTTLTDLPGELVQLILSYLDSWALCSLALVSTATRAAVAELLDLRGCVALQWEPGEGCGTGVGRPSWSVGYRRWFFSPSFDRVSRWGLEQADTAVTAHLQHCPFNDRTQHRKPDTNSKEWKNFMAALNVKIQQKRESEWFIQ